MSKYTLEIQSGQIYPGPTETNVSELLEAKVNCEWSDDSDVENDFDITFESDRNRFSESVTINENQEVLTNVEFYGYFKVRNNLSIYPRCGFYGSFFKYTIQKSVPADGNFKFFGIQLMVIRTNIDSEFFAPSGAISNGWE